MKRATILGMITGLIGLLIIGGPTTAMVIDGGPWWAVPTAWASMSTVVGIVWGLGHEMYYTGLKTGEDWVDGLKLSMMMGAVLITSGLAFPAFYWWYEEREAG